MDYVADSDGVYAGAIPDTASLDVGSRYDLVITANGGAGLQKEYTIRCEAVKADE
jgi:FtsP/CotA-like multicopper oxidase with cupredoxin domain